MDKNDDWKNCFYISISFILTYTYSYTDTVYVFTVGTFHTLTFYNDSCQPFCYNVSKTYPKTSINCALRTFISDSEVKTKESNLVSIT